MKRTVILIILGILAGTGTAVAAPGVAGATQSAALTGPAPDSSTVLKDPAVSATIPLNGPREVVSANIVHRHGILRPVKKGQAVSAREGRKALGKRAAELSKRIAALEKSRKAAVDKGEIAVLDLQIGVLREELETVTRQERALARSPGVPKPGRSVTRR